MEGVYLLHFSRPFKHARHYLGWADDIERRVAEHRSGNGRAGRLCQVVVAEGIELALARTWEGAGRNEERRLKNRGGASRLCPICRALEREG